MKIPARCNKRSCQARRNLSMRPERYIRWPTCHLVGCTGKMYVVMAVATTQGLAGTYFPIELVQKGVAATPTGK